MEPDTTAWSPTRLRAAYLEQYPECQYVAACGQYVDFWGECGIARPNRVVMATEVEHIWNRRGPNSECWSNYASVCRPAHLWKHANSVVARIAITWFKWQLELKAIQTLMETDFIGRCHFDRNELRAAAGFSVLGWVENKLEEVDLPTWCEEMALELIEAH